MTFDLIPDELKSIPRWVCAWKGSKIPMRANEVKAASSTDPSTWDTFDNAARAVQNGTYDYLGFVFADDGIIGIDIDAGYDEYSLLSSLSIDIMKACESYTEKSRSGRGIHVFLKGSLPFKGRNNGEGVEIYRTGRYFIVTGQKLVFSAIAENQNAIDYIVSKYFANVEKESEDKPRGERIYSPIYTNVKDSKISLTPKYPPIPQGSRHISLVSLAGQLHNQGYSKKDIYNELCSCNKAACSPPLPVREIEAIVTSVTKYRR